ncbi:MAG: LemA family protein [Planctomycetota bacterium]
MPLVFIHDSLLLAADPQIVLPCVGAALALLFVVFSLLGARKRRLIETVPTCKTAGVFIGLVEIKGTAEAEQPLRSYLAAVPCVHYSWSVQERWSRTVTESYTDSQGKRRTRTRRESGWSTVASGGEQMSFYLRDETGVVRVDPAKATIEDTEVFGKYCGRSDPLYYAKGPAHAVSHSDHYRHFRESAIPLHRPLYVMGKARLREDVVAPEIAYHRDAPLFLISTRSEERITRGLKWQTWVLGVLALVSAVGAWMAGDRAVHVDLASRISTYLMVALVAGLVWTLGWVWMVYNSLVRLSHRVEQAWSNVDVQLKRRADLIPSLVKVAEGLKDYEGTLQEQLAILRSQVAPTAPGRPGPDPQGCAAQVAAIIEKYPELEADEAFLGLQEELIATEQRIALARAYYNEIVSFHNARLEIVPDRYVAVLAGLKPRRFITAEDFERAAVEVQLAE